MQRTTCSAGVLYQVEWWWYKRVSVLLGLKWGCVKEGSTKQTLCLVLKDEVFLWEIRDSEKAF